MSLKSVLITGGGGFLGSSLAENYLKKGWGVVAVDNFCTGLRSNQNFLATRPEAQERLFFIEADVVEPWSWTAKIPKNLQEDIQYVFHFASPASPPHYQKLGKETLWVNSLGLDRCLVFADAHKARVIFASTSEVYGDPAFSPQPESYWGNVNSFGPRACYDEAKRFGEALIFTHNLKYGTKHGLVRIFNTYGPRMNPNDGRVIINLLVQALRGEPLTVYGEGKQTRSFCYVDDLVAGIEKYAEAPLAEPVNIGNDREFTILELAQMIQRIFSDRKLQITLEPLPKDDPQQRRPELTKARKLLSGWQSQVSLEQGLLRMIEWLKSEGHL